MDFGPTCLRGRASSCTTQAEQMCPAALVGPLALPIPIRATALSLPLDPQPAHGNVGTSLPGSSQQDWMDMVLLLVLTPASWPLPTQ